MADYREHYEGFRAAGATVMGIAVDAPETSEALRCGLRLPFPILCDTARRVIREWDLYNPLERGGIAKPAIFIIQPDQRVRYAAIDGVATRAPASEIIRVLQTTGAPVRRKMYFPRPADFFHALRGFGR